MALVQYPSVLYTSITSTRLMNLIPLSLSLSDCGILVYHCQIAPQDRDVPAVIRVTFTVSVTAVNCTDLEVHFCTYVTLMNIRSTTTTTTTTQFPTSKLSGTVHLFTTLYRGVLSPMLNALSIDPPMPSLEKYIDWHRKT